MIGIFDLMEYGRYTRRRYLEALGALPWEEVVKDRGASFNSLRDVFLHSIAASDACINYIIPGKLDDYTPPKFEEFQAIKKIRVFVDQFEAKVNQLLKKLTPNELSKKVNYRHRNGTFKEVTVEDVLVHAFLEEIYHRGELIALLWQMDIDPNFMGWIRYLDR